MLSDTVEWRLANPGQGAALRTARLTVVLVGSSQSKLACLGEGPRMYTPRGYAKRIDRESA